LTEAPFDRDSMLSWFRSTDLITSYGRSPKAI
jgi:hypothetical protein